MTIVEVLLDKNDEKNSKKRKEVFRKAFGPRYRDFPKEIKSKFPVLKDLREELEGTFHVIAHAGKAYDKKFIKERIDYFKKKYPMLVPNSVYEELRIPNTNVEIAYITLITLLESNPSPERIMRDCKEALFDHIIPPEPGEQINF